MSGKNPEYDFLWCPGCGDFGVRRAMEFAMQDWNIERETPMTHNVVVAGIGCSGNTVHLLEGEQPYGFHGIHGRSLPIALGVKMAREELNVVVVAGDGDFLSIGMEHIGPQAARNLNICAVVMDNGIYGLTKGQYSPTSKVGHVTKATPNGSIDIPLNPPLLALGAQATFVARTIDRWQKHLAEMMERSYHHDGGSFIEIYQNCNIFNDNAFEEYTGKEKFDNVIELKHNQPMLFAKETRGIKMDGSNATVVDMEKHSIDEILVHDETNLNQALIISNWTSHTILPEPIGVLYCVDKPTYNQEMVNQINGAKKAKGEGNVQDLLNAGDTWTVN